MTENHAGFLGERLVEARTVRGYTQDALASIVGVSNRAISFYEKGNRKPSWDTLSKLAKELNVPVHFFTRAKKRECTGAIYYRSLTAATKAGRTRAEIYYSWLRDVMRVVTEYVTLIPNNFAPCKVGADPSRISHDTIDSVITEIKSFWKLDNQPVQNMVGLLEKNGGIVVRRELGTAKLDAFSNWVAEEDTPYFILGKGKSAVRSRFDAAHELAHIALHRYVPQRVFNNPNYFNEIEGQAHYFAGAFLLPEENFLNDIPYRITLDSLIPVKSRWKVSLGAIIMRLWNLQFISDSKKQRLFAEISRRGWRKQEPLDDEMEYEKPVIVRSTFDLIAEQGIDCAKLFITALGLYPSDAEDAVGLKGYFVRREEGENNGWIMPNIKVH